MAEVCYTDYAVFGENEETRKVYAFMQELIRNSDNVTGNMVFQSEYNVGSCEDFVLCVNEDSLSCVRYDEGTLSGKDVLSFTVKTKYSPEHEMVESVIMKTVGHKMKYLYDSECIGCCEYRTNDSEHIVFEGGFVWDYDGFEKDLTEEDVLDIAEERFGIRFPSLEAFNEYALKTIGQEAVIEYTVE